MGHIQQGLLVLAVILGPLVLGAAPNSPIYFPDDPIQTMPPPLAVGKLYVHKVDQLYDFILNSVRWTPRPPAPAGAINTLGDAPNSAWFTNRHGLQRLTRQQLQRGPAEGPPPTPPFTVVGGKTEGITPGFRMEDAKGRLYFVKLDPLPDLEMTTAADVIVSRFLYAIGYNVPENDIVIAKLADFHVSDKAELTETGGKKRKMTRKDFQEIVESIPHYRDGSFRLMASLKIEGEPVGPFYYEGLREDDPNDLVRHENRRDLRALCVFFEWLNNTDARAGNTYDVVVRKNGVPFIKHYLVDFGSALGSDGDRPKDARLGHEFMIATPSDALWSILSLGMLPRSWERIHYRHLPGVGHFTSKGFDPDTWKSDYPNPAFLSRLPDDDYWAAKQIMAFTDDDIRAIVETGRFSNPNTVEYLTATLAESRNKIGQTFFAKVLPLDNFRIENNELRFDDLAAYKFRLPQNYEVNWFEFDNITGRRTRIDTPPLRRIAGHSERCSRGVLFLGGYLFIGRHFEPCNCHICENAERISGRGVFSIRNST